MLPSLIEIAEFEVAPILRSLGHRQDQSQIAFRDLFSQAGRTLPCHFRTLDRTCRIASAWFRQRPSLRTGLEPVSGEVVLKEENPLLSRRQHLDSWSA